MAGPIPVFSFVFAAYAATSGGKRRNSGNCAVSTLAPGASFRTAWRTRTTRGAVFAKIKLIGGSGLDLQLAVKSSSETGEEIWLSEIVESGLGFLGAPVETSGRSRQSLAVQQIRFHVINVLDWRIGESPSPDVRPTAVCAFAPISEIAASHSDTAIP